MDIGFFCIVFFFMPSCWSDGPGPSEVHPEPSENKQAISSSSPYFATERDFIGPPAKAERVPGCEGCGQRGSFRFMTNGNIEFILSGSDIADSGTYKIRGKTITVTSGSGTVFVFQLGNNEKEIVDKKNGAIFRDKRYSW